MKKISAIFICGILATLLTGCQSGTTNNSSTNGNTNTQTDTNSSATTNG